MSGPSPRTASTCRAHHPSHRRHRPLCPPHPLGRRHSRQVCHPRRHRRPRFHGLLLRLRLRHRHRPLRRPAPLGSPALRGSARITSTAILFASAARCAATTLRRKTIHTPVRSAATLSSPPRTLVRRPHGSTHATSSRPPTSATSTLSLILRPFHPLDWTSSVSAVGSQRRDPASLSMAPAPASLPTRRLSRHARRRHRGQRHRPHLLRHLDAGCYSLR
jgi:hypothetical protein